MLWLLLLLLVHRLPPGLLRDLAAFLPAIGLVDDVLAVVVLLRYAARSVPRDVVEAAWPAEPRLLHRLLTGRRPPVAR